MYWYVPVLLTVYFGLKRYFQVSLVTFVLIDSSIRAFHNIRQFYGISKWYQKLNDSLRLGSDYFLYFFCSTPMLIGPLKSGKWNSGFLWLGTSDVLYTILLGCYGLVLILWICYEFSKAGRGLEWNRLFAIAFPACVYSLTYIFDAFLWRRKHPDGKYIFLQLA